MEKEIDKIKKEIIENCEENKRYVDVVSGILNKKYPNWKKDWSIHLKREQHRKLLEEATDLLINEDKLSFHGDGTLHISTKD